MNQRLNELLLSFEGLEEDIIFQRGREIYSQQFLSEGRRGTLIDSKGEAIEFHADRYDHAFRTSEDRARRSYSKDKVAVERIIRLLWIKAILQECLVGTECWLVRPNSARMHPLDRAYVLWDPGYIIWTWPRKDAKGWRFSSAYPVPPKELARYLRGGSKQWRL